MKTFIFSATSAKYEVQIFQLKCVNCELCTLILIAPAAGAKARQRRSTGLKRQASSSSTNQINCRQHCQVTLPAAEAIFVGLSGLFVGTRCVLLLVVSGEDGVQSRRTGLPAVDALLAARAAVPSFSAAQLRLREPRQRGDPHHRRRRGLRSGLQRRWVSGPRRYEFNLGAKESRSSEWKGTSNQCICWKTHFQFPPPCRESSIWLMVAVRMWLPAPNRERFSPGATTGIASLETDRLVNATRLPSSRGPCRTSS